MSKVVIAGLVATTPRNLKTAEGLSITSFRLAEYDSEKEGETTNWYTVTGFKTIADNMATSINKGERVIVMGELGIRDWDNGERSGTSVEVQADSIGHDLAYGSSEFSRNVLVNQTKKKRDNNE
jgi:single-strand DNA-binding protein